MATTFGGHSPNVTPSIEGPLAPAPLILVCDFVGVVLVATEIRFVSQLTWHDASMWSINVRAVSLGNMTTIASVSPDAMNPCREHM